MLGTLKLCQLNLPSDQMDHPARNEETYTKFVFLNLSSQRRSGRFVRGAVQHDAVPVLRLQRRVPLRQPQRQVLLALHQRPHPHDAGRKLRHQGVHLEVSALPCHPIQENFWFLYFPISGTH